MTDATPGPHRSRPFTIARLMGCIGLLAVVMAAVRWAYVHNPALLLLAAIAGLLLLAAAAFAASVAALANWLFDGGSDLAEGRGFPAAACGLVALAVLAALLAMIVRAVPR